MKNVLPGPGPTRALRVVPLVLLFTGCLSIGSGCQQKETRPPSLVRDAGRADTVVEVRPVPVTIAVDVATPGRVVPATFAGVSVEWSHVQTILGDTNGGVNPVTVQLLRNFEAEGHKAHIRIGGNSTDRTWLVEAEKVAPVGASVNVTPAFLATLQGVQSALGVPLILGVNLGLDDPALAAAELLAYAAAFPPGVIEAFELGNEPDLYKSTGRRATTYAVADYQADVVRFLAVLSPLVMDRPLFALPATAGGSFNVPAIIAAEKTRMAVVTQHGYPFSVCSASTVPPTAADLLTDRGTVNFARSYAARLQAATAAGLPFRLGETNSAACGGAAESSDVFAAGIWGAHVMLELASMGAAGINFHTGGKYSPFVYRDGAPVVQGLYYGMLLFARATAAGGKFLPVQVTTTARVRAWATLGNDGAVRVAILNEDPTAPGQITIKLDDRRTDGELHRLVAPALNAHTGISFAGQTFDGTTDGKPTSDASPETVTSTDEGSYAVEMKPGSGAVLIVR